jgi:hypothetical protein
VPDGMIVLFSGMGPGAQEQLNVGVGALAGSTVMLITIPWVLSVYAGRVDIEVWEGRVCREGYMGGPCSARSCLPASPHFFSRSAFLLFSTFIFRLLFSSRPFFCCCV